MSARGGKKKGAKKKAPSWQCNWCHTSKTSCKRGGPDGLQTLCDTCNLRWTYAHDYRELELRRETHTRS